MDCMINNFFDEIVGKYKGAKISILGSGPTLNDHNSKINDVSDIVIACNGSLMALNSKDIFIDYFTCIDRKSPTRQWFYKSKHFFRKNLSSVVRIIPPYLLPFDKLSLPSKFLRSQLEEELLNFEGGKISEDYDLGIDFRIDKYHLFLQNSIVSNLRKLDFFSNAEVLDISKDILVYASVTGVGAQMAYRMGASEINLFGCTFNNPENSGTYAYNNKGESGVITDRQRRNMNIILSSIKSTGVQINSYGLTTLNVPDIIY